MQNSIDMNDFSDYPESRPYKRKTKGFTNYNFTIKNTNKTTPTKSDPEKTTKKLKLVSSPDNAGYLSNLEVDTENEVQVLPKNNENQNLSKKSSSEHVNEHIKKDDKKGRATWTRPTGPSRLQQEFSAVSRTARNLKNDVKNLKKKTEKLEEEKEDLKIDLESQKSKTIKYQKMYKDASDSNEKLQKSNKKNSKLIDKLYQDKMDLKTQIDALADYFGAKKVRKICETAFISTDASSDESIQPYKR